MWDSWWELSSTDYCGVQFNERIVLLHGEWVEYGESKYLVCSTLLQGEVVSTLEKDLKLVVLIG